MAQRVEYLVKSRFDSKSGERLTDGCMIWSRRAHALRGNASQ